MTESKLQKEFYGDILTKEETYSLPIGQDGSMREVGRVKVTINPFPAKGDGHVCGVVAHFHGFNIHTAEELAEFAHMAGEACEFVRRMNDPTASSERRVQTAVFSVAGTRLPDWVMRALLSKDGAYGVKISTLGEGDCYALPQEEDEE